MKGLLAAILALLLGAGLLADEAQAKGRLGGGRNIGAQRQAVTPQKQATAPQQNAQQAPAQNRWLGPLAGLAAGLGLGWLFGQGGLSAVLGVLLLALGAGFILMLLLRALAHSHTERQPMQYAGAGDHTLASPPSAQGLFAAEGPQPIGRNQVAPNIPAGFDVPEFLGQAKQNFVALQEANDRGDLDALREVTTEEMFGELKGEVLARGGERQQTDVVSLNAALLEVATEGATHWASVRFFGTIREDVREIPASFEEVWHLQKPVDGSSGWLLAGIQQVS
jgi:predicted lipid-binding transport protein (Tim44 family)